MKNIISKTKNDKAIILFTRIPEAGKVKTRMMPYLSPNECKELQTCCIKDTLSSINMEDVDIYVNYEPSGDLTLLKQICGDCVCYLEQQGDGLGARMTNAIKHVLSKGYKSTILVGSDIPSINSEDLIEGFKVLESYDAVVGPSKDGGYYLIGMKEILPGLFENKKYGHGTVLEELLAVAQKEAITVGTISDHQDLDTREDLLDYMAQMRHYKNKKETCTSRFIRNHLAISIIIPTYNEEKIIDCLVSQLENVSDKAEIIFVDGGSKDSTIKRIPDKYILLNSDKGRAIQLNAGAEKASGDVLFFLHADSKLPENFIEEIRSVISKYEVGCFGIKFSSPNPLMRINQLISNHRAFHRNIVFGDQGLFIMRDLFESIGRFPKILIMEDYQLSLNLKEMGIKVGKTHSRICTSDRRYSSNPFKCIKVMFTMWLLRRKYRAGVSPDKISEEYRDIR
ncbi:TIGR04283 family arsenosugar biosynthesis glycosyltransferase [Mogibacterium sp.]